MKAKEGSWEELANEIYQSGVLSGKKEEKKKTLKKIKLLRKEMLCTHCGKSIQNKEMPCAARYEHMWFLPEWWLDRLLGEE